MLARRILLSPKARQTRARRGTAASTRLWLFDLDNTLHDTSHAIFPAIDRNMTAAVCEALSVDDAQADHLRQLYWRRYGATVIGMMRHHGVRADSFLARCHELDIPSLLRSEPGLPVKLRRLPGRKVLLTNAPYEYARLVLKHLGILAQFDSLWAIEHMQWHGQYRPKPAPALLRYVLAREGVAPHQATLVEDTLVNLRAARQVGLRTVHVYHPLTPFNRQNRARAGYVDLRVNSIADLLLRRRLVRGRRI
jgi:putative hydrolase of the HAD superfamily